MNVKRRLAFNDGVWIRTRAGVAFTMAPLFTRAYGPTLCAAGELPWVAIQVALDTVDTTTVVLTS